jgi:hypothetical protein
LGSRRRWSLGRFGLGRRLFLGLDLLFCIDYLPLHVKDLFHLRLQLLGVHLALPELLEQAFAQLRNHLAPLLAQGAHLAFPGAADCLIQLAAKAAGLFLQFVKETHTITSPVVVRFIIHYRPTLRYEEAGFNSVTRDRLQRESASAVCGAAVSSASRFLRRRRRSKISRPGTHASE